MIYSNQLSIDLDFSQVDPKFLTKNKKTAEEISATSQKRRLLIKND